MTRGLAFLALLIAALLASGPLRADCANPDGANGEQIYNADHDVMQFCNGVKWISMAASGLGTEVDPKVGALENGKWCSSTGSIITCTEDAPVSGAGGSSGQVQYNDGTGLGGAAAVTYATTGDVLMITAQDAADKPLVIKGAETQTGNLLEFRDSNGDALGHVTPSGGLSLAGGLGVTGAAVLSGTLGVSGAATLNSTLDVTGALTAASFSGSGAGLTSIPLSALAASGTASASTYLRGDGTWAAPAGVGGLNTQVQFNDSGAFGGSANLTWNNGTNTLTIGGTLNATTVSATNVAASGTMSAATPVASGDVATKSYVDTAVAAAGSSGPWLCATTETNYTGNLGGVSGADAKCVTEFGSGWTFSHPSKLGLLHPGAQNGWEYTGSGGDPWVKVGGTNTCSSWTSTSGNGKTINLYTSSFTSSNCSGSNPIFCCNF